MIRVTFEKPDPKTGKPLRVYHGSLLVVLWQILSYEVREFYRAHRDNTNIAAAVVATITLLYAACVNYVPAQEVGLAWNEVTGNLWVQRPGVHLTSPFTIVSRIDTRPTRVCVHTASRMFSCKLVRFNPEGFREFVAVEGHRYYWWSNRLSYNSGYPEEYRGMHDLLRGYAYSGMTYPFLTVEATQ